MNNQRRKELQRAIRWLEGAREIIEFEADAEQEFADNMPENLQGSERHDTAEETAMRLADQVDEINNTVTEIEEVVMQ